MTTSNGRCGSGRPRRDEVAVSYSVGVYAEAARWYRKAGDQGDAFAQFSLGLMYGVGDGVPKNYIEAHMWLNLAASRASSKDKKLFTEARDVAAGKMTPKQIAEAQRRAREWKPKAGGPMK